MIASDDDGPGVAPFELEKLFDPFYRVDPSRISETGGVGLGLAIVKSCVEACGGIVGATNRIPHGLEVRIRLNRAESRRRLEGNKVHGDTFIVWLADGGSFPCLMRGQNCSQ